MNAKSIELIEDRLACNPQQHAEQLAAKVTPRSKVIAKGPAFNYNDLARILPLETHQVCNTLRVFNKKAQSQDLWGPKDFYTRGNET